MCNQLANSYENDNMNHKYLCIFLKVFRLLKFEILMQNMHIIIVIEMYANILVFP